MKDATSSSRPRASSVAHPWKDLGLVIVGRAVDCDLVGRIRLSCSAPIVSIGTRCSEAGEARLKGSCPRSRAATRLHRVVIAHQLGLVLRLMEERIVKPPGRMATAQHAEFESVIQAELAKRKPQRGTEQSLRRHRREQHDTRLRCALQVFLRHHPTHRCPIRTGSPGMRLATSTGHPADLSDQARVEQVAPAAPAMSGERRGAGA